MCLEWVWYATDVQPDDCTYCNCKYHSRMLKNTLFLGAMVSAGPAAFAASLVGLKTLLFTGLSITAFGSAVIACSADVLPWLCVGRILHGLGAGTVFVVVPNYASEISEPKTRSVLIGFHYLNLLIGVLLSQIVNEYYVYSYVNIGIIAMVILNLVALFFVSDPPYYRLKCDSHDSAFDFEQKVFYSTHTNRLYTKFKNRNTAENSIQLYLMLKEYEFIRPIIVNVCLILFQQFTGFILLTSKLKCLYGTLHMSEKISDVVAITLIQVITCILCLLIVGVLGKKTLLFISGFGMTVTLCLIIHYIIHVTLDKEIKHNNDLRLFSLITIYVICYSIGYGPIPWILMPELCPRKSKLWTSGFTVSLYALLNLINNQYFSDYTKQTLFGVDIILLIFTIVNITAVIFSITFVPEIKD